MLISQNFETRNLCKCYFSMKWYMFFYIFILYIFDRCCYLNVYEMAEYLMANSHVFIYSFIHLCLGSVKKCEINREGFETDALLSIVFCFLMNENLFFLSFFLFLVPIAINWILGKKWAQENCDFIYWMDERLKGIFAIQWLGS